MKICCNEWEMMDEILESFILQGLVIKIMVESVKPKVGAKSLWIQAG